ncbi:MAG: GDP-mannose 4,6-dehydratase [Parvibaculales bacterium]
MAHQKTALVTGITGQDGAYLTKLLVEKGYTVTGAVRRASTLNIPRLNAMGLMDDVHLNTLDMQDFTSIVRLIEEVAPDEIYNLGGQSSVQASFQQPLYTGETSGMGTLRLLEAVNLVKPDTRLFEASSSEIFGLNGGGTVDEAHGFHPRSPYGAAKLMAYWAVVNYREAHGLHASNGILFNHESPLRGMDFVTRKITATLAQIACGGQTMLRLGNLDNARDWGFAGDYVEAMWAMLQQDAGDDFVVATGQTHTVKQFVELAAQAVGLDLVFEGEGLDTKGLDRKTGRQLVGVSADFYRPSEPDPMVGNAAKAKRVLGWQPRVNFEQLVTMMAESDLERARKEQVWY